MIGCFNFKGQAGGVLFLFLCKPYFQVLCEMYLCSLCELCVILGDKLCPYLVCKLYLFYFGSYLFQ